MLPVLAEAVTAQEDTESVAPPRPVKTLTITDQSASRERYFVGIAQAARQVTLRFRGGGTVAQMTVAVGDTVVEGDPVARLDRVPFQTEVDRLSAELLSEEATFENTSLQTGRQRQLVERDVAGANSLRPSQEVRLLEEAK